MNFRNTYLGIEYDLFSNGKLAMSMLPRITDVAMNGQISIRHNKICDYFPWEFERRGSFSNTQ